MTTVHKTSAVGNSGHVLDALLQRRQQGSLHEMFMSPLAVAIALPRIAMTVKMLRSSMQSELRRSGYVRTAYSRGDSRRRVLYGHVLRNALVPVVTFLARTWRTSWQAPW